MFVGENKVTEFYGFVDTESKIKPSCLGWLLTFFLYRLKKSQF